MRVKRVLLVTMARERGGAEAVLDLIAGRLDTGRFTPVIALPEGGTLAGVWRSRGWTVVETPPLPRFRNVAAGRRLARHLQQLIVQEQIDIVHTHGVAAQVYGAVAAARADRPVVWHVHDRCESRWSADGALHRMACTRRHDIVIAISETVALSLAGRIPAAQVEIIPNGVEPVLVSPIPRGSPGPLIVWCGRLQRWKGAHLFLQAAAVVAASEPAARFAIVGGTLFGLEPGYAGELRRAAQTLGLETVVDFPGHVDDARGWLAAATAVAHSSVTPEPFGLVVAEAMMQAKPVVAFRQGGPAEMIVDGHTGRLVAPGDVAGMARALLDVLASSATAAAMGTAGRERALSRYHADVMARRVEAAYDRAAA